MRVGIFGGTFDPVHTGHIRCIIEAKEKLNLDLIAVVPAGKPPHKNLKIFASSQDRLNMLKIALKKWNWIKIFDWELKNKEISYTFDTLKKIRSYFGSSNEYYLLAGSDWEKKIKMWKNFSYIKKNSKIIFLERDISNRFSKKNILKIPVLEISSTIIRQKISEGKDITLLVPQSVADYIKKHRLYI